MATPCRFRLDDGQIEVVDEQVAQVLRKKTPSQRVEMIFECNQTMRQIVACGIRRQHPDWTLQRVSLEVARRFMDEPA